MAIANVAHGAAWVQVAPLPFAETHATFKAWTGVAEINGTSAQSEAQNRTSFLMISPLIGWLMEYGLLQRRGAGKTSVAAVGAHLVVAERDQ